MLDEYVEDQKIIYNILINAVKKNKYSHAYIFEKNNYENADKLILAFVKYLLCPKNYSNNELCGKCTQCDKIDRNICLDLEIINPDGLWIKKEQLEKLQLDFSKKSLENNKKIYIINEAEKLNVQAANSILKFLEEPEENIVAILVTNNLYQILDTIVSRCQIISLNRKNSYDNMSTLDKILSIINSNTENLELLIETSIKFVNYLEKNRTDTILMTNKLWHNNIKDRNDYLISYNILLFYYKDIINYKLNRI